MNRRRMRLTACYDHLTPVKTRYPLIREELFFTAFESWARPYPGIV